MDLLQEILIDFELHSVESIRAKFIQGLNPNESWKGRPLFWELVDMYTRGPRFKECVRVFVENGLVFDDKVLLAVLLDDGTQLKALISENRNRLHQRYTFKSTFTPLIDASLLHICIEYNHINCARVLIESGLSVDSRAGFNKDGFGGQTAMFHAVNQHANFNLESLLLLLEHKADPLIEVKGLVWGEGYEWETFIPAVNVISYSMMGLLRQFQRNEKDIYSNVQVLMKAAYNLDYLPTNLPNKYLEPNK